MVTREGVADEAKIVVVALWSACRGWDVYAVYVCGILVGSSSVALIYDTPVAVKTYGDEVYLPAVLDSICCVGVVIFAMDSDSTDAAERLRTTSVYE